MSGRWIKLNDAHVRLDRIAATFAEQQAVIDALQHLYASPSIVEMQDDDEWLDAGQAADAQALALYGDDPNPYFWSV